MNKKNKTNNSLDYRMKEFYEIVPKIKLIKKIPVAIRIDGKAFHTFTKGFKKPFDEILIKSMQDTMKYLCENIQGCVLGYTQSDEITLILVDYKQLSSSAWFDYEVQKICSIVASMATLEFNRRFKYYITEELTFKKDETYFKYHETLMNSCEKGAMFDARCFNIPKEEVTNLLYWRQLDASKNSIQMVGQANFNHRELQNKNCNEIQEMLWKQKNINWNNLPTHQKRGSCCIKEKYIKEGVTRSHWIIDKNIPIFKNTDREYIEKLINF